MLKVDISSSFVHVSVIPNMLVLIGSKPVDSLHTSEVVEIHRVFYVVIE